MTAGASGARVAVIVQARTSSRRLPGKVLEPLAGAPAILRMMERVARVRGAAFYAVATSDQPSDDRLAGLLEDNGIPVVRGPLDDVLRRFLLAVPAEFEVVVRLTGDCPLVDPELVDRHIELFLQGRPWVQYATNALERTQPDGLDVEVVERALLAEADRSATTPYDREHVLPWVRRSARTLLVTQKTNLSGLCWTMDTPADYAAIAAIYSALYPVNPEFGADDVYQLMLRRPELIHLIEGEVPDFELRVAWQARIRDHQAVARHQVCEGTRREM